MSTPVLKSLDFQIGFKIVDPLEYNQSDKKKGVFYLIRKFEFPTPPAGYRWKMSTDPIYPRSDGWWMAGNSRWNSQTNELVEVSGS